MMDRERFELFIKILSLHVDTFVKNGLVKKCNSNPFRIGGTVSATDLEALIERRREDNERIMVVMDDQVTLYCDSNLVNFLEDDWKGMMREVKKAGILAVTIV